MRVFVERSVGLTYFTCDLSVELPSEVTAFARKRENSMVHRSEAHTKAYVLCGIKENLMARLHSRV
jgi:hypothetical protein